MRQTYVNMVYKKQTMEEIKHKQVEEGAEVGLKNVIGVSRNVNRRPGISHVCNHGSDFVQGDRGYWLTLGVSTSPKELKKH